MDNALCRPLYCSCHMCYIGMHLTFPLTITYIIFFGLYNIIIFKFQQFCLFSETCKRRKIDYDIYSFTLSVALPPFLKFQGNPLLPFLLFGELLQQFPKQVCWQQFSLVFFSLRISFASILNYTFIEYRIFRLVALILSHRAPRLLYTPIHTHSLTLVIDIS